MGKSVTLAEAMNVQGVLVKRMQDDIKFISQNCVRDAKLRDPHEKEGGSEKLVTERIQAFYDKLERFLNIRRLINQKNSEVTVTIEATEDEDGATFKKEKILKDWLDWDRHGRVIEETLWKSVSQMQSAQYSRVSVVSTEDVEKKLEFAIPLTRAPKELAAILTMHSKLDGAKSVINATKTIDIP